MGHPMPNHILLKLRKRPVGGLLYGEMRKLQASFAFGVGF